MMNKPLPFKGLNIRIPIIFPIKGRGFINYGSGLTLHPQPSDKVKTDAMTSLGSYRQVLPVVSGKLKHFYALDLNLAGVFGFIPSSDV